MVIQMDNIRMVFTLMYGFNGLTFQNIISNENRTERTKDKTSRDKKVQTQSGDIIP